jgi:hypothetical protein
LNKNLQLTIAWFALAFLVTLGAVWQAQVTVAREVIARNQPPPPPVKTRRAVRPTAQEAPKVDYATRKKQGLTDREIGWIVEDFHNAGLDLGIRAAPQEEYLAQRRAQDRWYRDALVEAWSLTPEQSAQVTAKLAELHDQAKADFIEALAAGPQPVEINGKWYVITSAEPIHRLINANLRLDEANNPYMPWNLGGFAAKPDDCPDSVTVDFLLPRPDFSAEEEGIQVTPPQKEKILPQLRKLHPAQLKLLLLVDPDKSKQIQAALEAS